MQQMDDKRSGEAMPPDRAGEPSSSQGPRTRGNRRGLRLQEGCLNGGEGTGEGGQNVLSDARTTRSTPAAREDFIQAIEAGRFEWNPPLGGLSYWQARYALFLGFEIWGEWTPYPGRTVRKRITRVELDGAEHIKLDTTTGAGLRFNRKDVHLWTDRNQPKAAQSARAIPRPGTTRTSATDSE